MAFTSTPATESWFIFSEWDWIGWAFALHGDWVGGCGGLDDTGILGLITFSQVILCTRPEGYTGMVNWLTWVFIIHPIHLHEPEPESKIFPDDPSTVNKGLTKDLGVSHDNIGH